MGDNKSYAALDWVVGEIGESLTQARQALEAYVANTEDTTRIRFCLTHIHQVHGSLQMVEFYGAALLAEEMENLAQALMNRSVKNDAEAQEVLMRAILQLPVYLDQVKHSRKDHPASVLPLLNDLRAVRGEALLTETKLFTPNMAPAHLVEQKPENAVTDNQQFLNIVGKLRQMYQYAAAGLIRDVNSDENTVYLNKVFARLRKLTVGSARQPLWDVSLALLEGLEDQSIEFTAAVKNILRQLDKEIKDLCERGIAGLDIFTNDELIKNILFYIARAKSNGKHVQRIRKLYKLEDSLPDTEQKSNDNEVMAPDLEAIRSVVSAIKDELDTIKHSLDVSLTDREEADIEEALPVIKRVADTMAVLGIGDLRKQIISQGEALEAAAAAGSVPHDLLMTVASKIIEIESSLELMASGSAKGDHIDGASPGVNALTQAQESVLRESRNGLEQAKDAIIEYIASQWNREHLTNVPAHLREIAGGLDMVPLHKPAAILNSCAKYIQQQLLDNQLTPEWSTLDTLADAIASVEYYLERLSGDREEEDEMLLGVAEDSVKALGYPADLDDSSDHRDDDIEPSIPASTSAANSFEPMAVISSETDIPAADLADPAEQMLEEDFSASSEIAAEEVSVENYSEINTEQPIESEDFGTPQIDVAQSNADQVSLSQSESSSVDQSSEEDESLIDDEIIEIFVEEATEVIATINEFFPKWAENFNDEESLTEFRRAFHTLKGSGRMVNANHVGELAWSIENMLNRIIDNTVEPNKGHVALINKVRPVLPSMVEAFENRKPHPVPELAAQVESWAQELSSGHIPEALFADETGSEPDAESELARDSQDAEDDENDSVLREIFASEAKAHIEVVEDYTRAMEESAPLYTPPSDAMQRAMHTLKGSAHMAEITPIAELATPLERFVKELRIYQVDIDADILQLIKDGVTYVQLVLGQIKENETLEIPRLGQYIARIAELKELTVAPLIRQDESKDNADKKIDPELLSIFMAEEMRLLLDADQLIEQWQETGKHPQNIEPLVEELKTLSIGSERANLPPMSTLADKLCKVYEAVSSDRLPADDSLFESLLAGHAELLNMVDAVAVGQNLSEVSEELADRLNNLLNTSDVVNTIPSLGGADGIDYSEHVSEAALPSVASIDEKDFGLPALEGEIELAEEEIDLDAIGNEDLALPGDDVLEITSEDFEFDSTIDVEIEIEAEDVQEQTESSEAVEEITEQPKYTSTYEVEIKNEEVAIPSTEQPEDSEEIDLEIYEIFIEEAEELLEETDEAIHDWEREWTATEYSESLKRALHTLKGGARLAGLMGLGELAHEMETLIIAKDNSPDIDESFFAILHDFQDKLINGTDKVKARVAGHNPDGLEEVLAATATETVQQESSDSAVEPEINTPKAGLVSSAEQSGVISEEKVAVSKEKSEHSSADILPFAPKPKPQQGEGFAMPAGREMGFTGSGAPSTAPPAARRSNGPQEVVKVSAELLEELVNLAGETSISRGRLEEQNSEVVFALDEMESTVQRLQEQLRRLDIETEAQMIFRQEQMEEAEDFDPLEMDRYSQLQQLSRSLVESASDLMDLTSTLNDKTRDTETLLLQQSRINTELQEGLMRSRMVPFSRLVPRLRRIVRQISTELSKQVSFELDNVEGELDRSVLERMIAPLEHMLRNAVDHGIETTEERAKSGKPETGRIVLGLSREGGDVLMRLVDDGRGINLEKVRAKAIERGLMTESAKLSDHDIMQFILHAGFTTADKVTQISGRGVGMDVVHAEIKQLGGAMFINSRWGEGTEFIIRLPFTVSVNRALMIQIGDDNYAIPLNTIEGIVRVSPFELEHYYQDENARFEYAGENYLVRYLGAMLSQENMPRLEGQTSPMPVVLVRTNEHALALQVDKLMGSREIVVKTIGPQFSAVEGLSGATVMGDGSVVVILDPHAMIRKEMALSDAALQALELAPQSNVEEQAIQTVMVVDDSVTVRKVTSRFLEREGFQVITAKDGADALQVLQDSIPDVMLLDIEMPRMDGFEVAKNIRTTSRLKDIPIIMITSRTGDKHRERALSLGVDKYLGKPYQEETLLSNIQELIGKSTE